MMMGMMGMTATERTRELLESIDKQVIHDDEEDNADEDDNGKDFLSSFGLYSNLTPSSTFYYSTLAASGWSPIMTLYGHPL